MLVFLLLTVVALCVRLYLVLPRGDVRPSAKKTASLAVFLGSGGHTAEMRTLLKSVDKERYTPRIYVYGAGDDMSLRAVAEIEGGDITTANYSLLALPRARQVGQGKLSTLVSAAWTLLVTTWYCFVKPLRRPVEPWADVLLLNGPGTAVVLVLVTYIRRVSEIASELMAVPRPQAHTRHLRRVICAGQVTIALWQATATARGYICGAVARGSARRADNLQGMACLSRLQS